MPIRPTGDARSAEPARRPPPYEPELAPAPARRSSRQTRAIQEYQRLVANPFLAVLALIAWFEITGRLLIQKQFVPLLLTVVGLSGVAFLLQYHCLDCGSTGWLFRWRRHACERVHERIVDDRPRRFRGPNPTTQAILWFYALLALAIIVAIVSRSFRAH